MYRIFASLSVFAVGLLAADLIIGLLGPDFNGLSAEYREHMMNSEQPNGRLDEQEMAQLRAELESAKAHVRLHILVGILAAIVTVLVQSVGVTYFIGTGRWCKEVVETYELDSDWTKQSSHLKRRSFPWALLGIGTVLGIAAFGAAADPGTLGEFTQRWVRPHFWLAIAGTLVIAICLGFQAIAISRNQILIDAIVREVRKIREDRGLAVEAG